MKTKNSKSTGLGIKNVTKLPDHNKKARLTDLTIEDRQSTRGIIDVDDLK
jgi:hypothetical protein